MALASWLPEGATLSRRWLTARLETGRHTDASRAPRRMSPGSLRPFHQARAKLQLLDKKEGDKMNECQLPGTDLSRRLAGEKRKLPA